MQPGQAVDCGDLAVNGIDCPLIGELGHADPRRVAVRFFSQPADEDAAAACDIFIGGRVIVVLATDDVRIHSRAAHVLADAVNDE